jgi:hypothetical protein
MYGGVRVQLHIFLILALDVGEWLVSFLACFIPEARGFGNHWIEVWLTADPV